MVNSLTTPLCDRLGIVAPIIQAPIGSAVTPELVAAVSGAGGLGMLALTWMTPDQAVLQIRQVRRLTDRPFGVNLVLDFPIEKVLTACLDEGVAIISTFWGAPDTVVRPVHDAGALLLHTVGSVAEAERAVQAGVDVIVAQGWEAGGHVRGEVTTMALVPAVIAASAHILAIGHRGPSKAR